MDMDAPIFVSWMLNFKTAFSLSSVTFFVRLFSSSSLSAIRVVSSANLRLLIFLPQSWFQLGFPGGSDGKESACRARDQGSIPGLGRFPGEGNGYPLQYSCLGNPMDRGNWLAKSMGSQRVGHDWATNTFTFFQMQYHVLDGILKERH